MQQSVPICSGGVAGQFTAAPPTCPGDTFTFRCTVTGSGTTLWRVNGSSNMCALAHVSIGDASCGATEESHAFIAAPGIGFETGGPSYSSTLSGTATPAIDGTLVECFGPDSNINEPGNRVGMSAILIVG